jgi:hypothetical protein
MDNRIERKAHMDADTGNEMIRKRDPDVRFTAVQEILMRLVRAYEDNNRYFSVSDAKIAKLIGISASAWNGYKNGYNLPGLAQALLIGGFIARELDLEERNRFMELCGHDPDVHLVRDSNLLYIIRNWDNLGEARKEMFEHATEVVGKAAGKKPGSRGKPG